MSEPMTDAILRGHALDVLKVIEKRLRQGML